MTENNQGGIVFDKEGKGAAMEISSPNQAPTLASKKYLFFGKVSVELQAAPGPGLITAIVLKSDTGDEIDWVSISGPSPVSSIFTNGIQELLGAYDKQAQSNYFYDGDPLYNTYNNTYDLDTSTFSEFHTYTIEWTEEKLAFSIDGTERKVWHVGEIPLEKWPQTPMQVKLGTWAVNNKSDAGEIAWAGGVPNWDEAPFKAYYRKLEIEDYTGWCKEVQGPVAYAFDERMGGWEDVKVSGCKKRLAPGMHTPHVPDNVETQQADSGYPVPSGAETTSGSNGGSSPSTTENGESPVKTADEENLTNFNKQFSSTAAAVVFLAWILMA